MITALDQATLALLEEHVRRLLTVMDFPQATVVCRHQEMPGENAPRLHIAIEAGEAGKQLIGPRGSHLWALQHLIRSLLYRELQAEVTITVDVNGYRLRREQNLQNLALATARQVQHTGRTIVLPAMNAADRRILHTALAQAAQVRTESMGEEPNRRVVVRPVFL